MAPTVYIGDPGLTLSEALNARAALVYVIQGSDAGGDAVLESAVEKLTSTAYRAGKDNPEALRLVEEEVTMQKRFRQNKLNP